MSRKPKKIERRLNIKDHLSQINSNAEILIYDAEKDEFTYEIESNRFKIKTWTIYKQYREKVHRTGNV